MYEPTKVTARDILRNYKKVFANIKKTKQPTVVFSQKEPQVAIVSLEDLEKLQQLRYKNSGQTMLNIAKKVNNILVEAGEKLPNDLSTNHDYYVWAEEKTTSKKNV